MDDKFHFKQLVFTEEHALYPYLDKLNKISSEINQETDRGAALFSASILDDCLQNILLSFFANHKVSTKLFKYPEPISSFSARQNICLALGLITEGEYAQCNAIRGIRNKFAHQAAYSIDFNTQEIAALCHKLSTYDTLKDGPYAKRKDLNRIVFFISTQSLLIQWTERIDYVSHMKRVILQETEDAEL